MNIGSERWLKLVRDGAAQLGLSVTAEQAGQFGRHAQWLETWNRKINLTAITDPKDVAIKHVIDAIAPAVHIPEEGHMLDIGTGAGFPGIPLKIMRPGQSMTLIDSARKKINFVKFVIRQMHLERISALHIRAEALAEAGRGTGKFGVIVCRALADPSAAVKLAGPLLAANGRIVLYQGPREAMSEKFSHMSHFSSDGRIYAQKTISFPLPHSNIKRSIIVLDSIQ